MGSFTGNPENQVEPTILSADNLGMTEHFLSSFPKVLKLPSAFVSRLGIGRQRAASMGHSQFIQTLTLLSGPGIWEDQLCAEFPDLGTKRRRAPTDKKGLQEAWEGCHPVPSRETGSPAASCRHQASLTTGSWVNKRGSPALPALPSPPSYMP